MPLDDKPDAIRGLIVNWGEPIEGSAQEMLAAAESDDDGEINALDEAKEFLRDLLKDGPVPAKRCKSAVSEAALSWTTVKRAKQALGVLSIKGGIKEGWQWQLPEGDRTGS